jgi:methionyl-tRNA formyltransferase
VRAFTPWPGTQTTWKGQGLKIHSGQVANGKAAPGSVVDTSQGIAVGTGDGLFVLKDVQLAGRKTMPVSEFVKGQADFVGAMLLT